MALFNLVAPVVLPEKLAYPSPEFGGPLGLKCPPADVKLGGSHRPTSWICNPCRPGGSACTSSMIWTP